MIEISLEQGTYSVDESDGVVQVCAVIVSGELEDTVAEVMIDTSVLDPCTYELQ